MAPAESRAGVPPDLVDLVTIHRDRVHVKDGSDESEVAMITIERSIDVEVLRLRVPGTGAWIRGVGLDPT